MRLWLYLAGFWTIWTLLLPRCFVLEALCLHQIRQRMLEREKKVGNEERNSEEVRGTEWDGEIENKKEEKDRERGRETEK